MSSGNPNVPGGGIQADMNRMQNVAAWLNGAPDPLGELTVGRPQSRCECRSDCCPRCHNVNVLIQTTCCDHHHGQNFTNMSIPGSYGNPSSAGNPNGTNNAHGGPPGSPNASGIGSQNSPSNPSRSVGNQFPEDFNRNNTPFAQGSNERPATLPGGQPCSMPPPQISYLPPGVVPLPSPYGPPPQPPSPCGPPPQSPSPYAPPPQQPSPCALPPQSPSPYAPPPQQPSCYVPPPPPCTLQTQSDPFDDGSQPMAFLPSSPDRDRYDSNGTISPLPPLNGPSITGAYAPTEIDADVSEHVAESTPIRPDSMTSPNSSSESSGSPSASSDSESSGSPPTSPDSGSSAYPATSPDSESKQDSPQTSMETESSAYPATSETESSGPPPASPESDPFDSYNRMDPASPLDGPSMTGAYVPTDIEAVVPEHVGQSTPIRPGSMTSSDSSSGSSAYPPTSPDSGPRSSPPTSPDSGSSAYAPTSPDSGSSSSPPTSSGADPCPCTPPQAQGTYNVSQPQAFCPAQGTFDVSRPMAFMPTSPVRDPNDSQGSIYPVSPLNGPMAGAYAPTFCDAYVPEHVAQSTPIRGSSPGQSFQSGYPYSPGSQSQSMSSSYNPYNSPPPQAQCPWNMTHPQGPPPQAQRPWNMTQPQGSPPQAPCPWNMTQPQGSPPQAQGTYNMPQGPPSQAQGTYNVSQPRAPPQAQGTFDVSRPMAFMPTSPVRDPNDSQGSIYPASPLNGPMAGAYAPTFYDAHVPEHVAQSTPIRQPGPMASPNSSGSPGDTSTTSSSGKKTPKFTLKFVVKTPETPSTPSTTPSTPSTPSSAPSTTPSSAPSSTPSSAPPSTPCPYPFNPPPPCPYPPPSPPPPNTQPQYFVPGQGDPNMSSPPPCPIQRPPMVTPPNTPHGSYGGPMQPQNLGLPCGCPLNPNAALYNPNLAYPDANGQSFNQNRQYDPNGSTVSSIAPGSPMYAPPAAGVYCPSPNYPNTSGSGMSPPGPRAG